MASTMSQVSQVTVSSPEVVLLTVASNSDLENSDDYRPLLVIEPNSHDQSNTPSKSLIRSRDIPAAHSGYIRILELNNPSTRNAISRALLAELGREIETIQRQFDPITRQEVPVEKLKSSNGYASQNWPTRALIIASALDSCFCSGADLKERKGFTPEQ